MKILKQYEGEEAKVSKYTRGDLGPIEDATDVIKWYIVEEGERPQQCQFETITETFQLTDEPNAERPHFLKAIQVFTVTRHSNEAIIQRMNDSLGMHLDENYPLWKRQKHLAELIEGVTGERLTYIDNLRAWEGRCRDVREQKESELINNNQLPAFDWEPVPQN